MMRHRERQIEIEKRRLKGKERDTLGQMQRLRETKMEKQRWLL